MIFLSLYLIPIRVVKIDSDSSDQYSTLPSTLDSDEMSKGDKNGKGRIYFKSSRKTEEVCHLLYLAVSSSKLQDSRTLCTVHP